VSWSLIEKPPARSQHEGTTGRLRPVNGNAASQHAGHRPGLLLRFLLCSLLAPLTLTGFVAAARADDPVVLQLRWEHEFQFAGYYAALWQGYYEREGLAVTIRPATTPEGDWLVPFDELQSGRAQFAVGGVDVLTRQGRGADLSVLAAIFQRTPAAWFALSDQPIPDPAALADLRLTATPGSDMDLQARAMFYANGIDPTTVRFVDAPVALASLLEHRTDAVSTYAISAQVEAGEKGIDLNMLRPDEYGVQFYGDMIYALEAYTRENPDITRRFLEASLDGWRYALENRVEIARRIGEELPRHVFTYDDLVAYNLAFARIMDDYVHYPLVPLGEIQATRWERIYDLLDKIGEIEEPFNARSMLYREASSLSNPVTLLSWLMGLVAIVTISLALWFRQSLWLAQAAVVVGVLAVQFGFEEWHKQDSRQRALLQTLERLGSIRTNLEQSIAQNLAELNGLAALVASNPDLDRESFEAYARVVIRQNPKLKNLAVAPDAVNKYVYPMAGNEGVIGLDYRRNAAQWDAVERIFETGEMLFAGPVNLIQGGQAFIGRAPIIVNSEGAAPPRVWGLVSAPIEVASFYRDAGLLGPDLGLQIAIRGVDGTGAAGGVFYGHASLFDDPQTVRQSVSFEGGSWQIAARSTTAVGTGPRLLLIRTGALLLGLLLMGVMFLRHNQLQARRAFDHQRRRFAEFAHEVESVARVGGWRMDASGQIGELSSQACQLLSLTEETTPRSMDQVFMAVSEPDPPVVMAQLRHAWEEQVSIELKLRIDNSGSDTPLWLQLIGDPILDENGERNLIGAVQDVTEKHITAQRIERQANYDELTGLPNRRLFRQRLAGAIRHAERQGNRLALLFIDLDNFKMVNDNLGHRAGDDLLRQAAARIESGIRETDLVARHSGDEFTVLFDGLREESALYNVVDNMVETLAKPFMVDGNKVFCGASIGIAIFPDDARDAETLLVDADQAMFEVKKHSRNGWHFYTDEMQQRSEHRHRMFNELIEAIRARELTVALQPIRSLADGRIVSCEALARWRRDDGEWVSPADFIPVAEETGLINQIDYFVLESAAAGVMSLNEETGEKIGVSVNVSPRVFLSKDQSLERWLALVEQVSRQLPLQVEITERLLIDRNREIDSALEQLSSLGVSIAIDDFGTGYSSLSYLTRFPIDCIKIDRSFIAMIGEGGKGLALLNSMLGMSRQLSLEVVAEGVETSEQLDYLRAHDCGKVQGYLTGRPTDIAAFREVLRREAGPHPSRQRTGSNQ
jgi:diguanylate cyclase (GGDEF)-like protein